MDIQSEVRKSESVRYAVVHNGKEVAHAYVYLIQNDDHDGAYAYLENVFVEESERGSGVGTKLLKYMIADVQERGCYKFFGTSRYTRPRVHDLYTRIGFKEWGKTFRMDFPENK